MKAFTITSIDFDFDEVSTEYQQKVTHKYLGKTFVFTDAELSEVEDPGELIVEGVTELSGWCVKGLTYVDFQALEPFIPTFHD